MHLPAPVLLVLLDAHAIHLCNALDALVAMYLLATLDLLRLSLVLHAPLTAFHAPGRQQPALPRVQGVKTDITQHLTEHAKRALPAAQRVTMEPLARYACSPTLRQLELLHHTAVVKHVHQTVRVVLRKELANVTHATLDSC